MRAITRAAIERISLTLQNTANSKYAELMTIKMLSNMLHLFSLNVLFFEKKESRTKIRKISVNNVIAKNT